LRQEDLAQLEAEKRTSQDSAKEIELSEIQLREERANRQAEKLMKRRRT